MGWPPQPPTEKVPDISEKWAWCFENNYFWVES